MKALYYTLIFCLLSSFTNFAGTNFSHASNIKHSYDVLNYKLNLNIYDCFKSPYPKSFSASNQITFKVDSLLNSIKLNASSFSLSIDSIRLLNSAILSFSQSSNILMVYMDRTYNPGEIVNIVIYYRHNNVSDTSWGTAHLTNGLRVNNGLVYTDCEPEGARRWFPCWDKPSDKATIDLTAKVPLNVKLGSNGLLIDSTINADTIYYHWNSIYPMATYLVVIAGCTVYNLDIKYWRKLSNPLDSIPIRFYYRYGSNPQRVEDSINLLTNFYSQKFGEYPFEKIGFAECDTYKDGCMEDQTLITLYGNCWFLVNMADHEFAHHWFGDLITCGTWADLWLNESFATYCEALYSENNQGIIGYKSHISFDSSSYFSSSYYYNEPIYNPIYLDSAGNDLVSLFWYSVRYSKGACVLYMLRNVLDDSVFFNVMYSYATDTNFMFKNAVTDDFTAKINQVTGQDYSWFINEWVKQPGHPVYHNTYDISNLGSNNWRVNFLAKQTQTNTPFHIMPIELRIYFTNSTDTLIKVFNNSNNQLFTFNFNKQPDSVRFDPSNKIILRQGTTAIGIKQLSNVVPKTYKLSQNYPNPFNPKTIFKFDIPKESYIKLIIYDLLGREIERIVDEKLKPGNYEFGWDGASYASGIYFLRIEASQIGGPTVDYNATMKMVLAK